MTFGISEWRQGYELTPIVLVGGIAKDMPGAMVPIISLLQPQNFSGGITSNASDVDPNTAAHFQPLPGSTLIENQYAEYPFANQLVAANAVIFQPLRLSMLMTAPAPAQGGYSAKTSAFTSLKTTLEQHNLLGGTYTVATPAYTYLDLLMLALRDVSGEGETSQVQYRWQFDFYQPLVTKAAAQAAQSSLMSRMSNGAQVSGDPPSYSGESPTVSSASSGVAPSVVPASTNTVATAAGQATGRQGWINPSPSSAATGPGGFVPGQPNE